MNHIQADAETIRVRTTQESAMEEDGREDDSYRNLFFGSSGGCGEYGAASPGFRRHFCNFVRESNPAVVILPETCISGDGDILFFYPVYLERGRSMDLWFDGFFPPLSLDTMNMLNREVLDDEIKDV
ncbi:hypothetical protein V6N13_042623 [Hibiscus sabdariffa]